MEVHCMAKVQVDPRGGAVEVKEVVKVTLEGSYQAIAALLRRLKWDELVAKELQLE